jgi:Fur family ferric uptake transcriptional regulator
MTRAHHTTTATRTYIERLRQKGHRITPQREMILEALLASSAHITAEEILAAVQTHTQAINIATVYRTIDLLFKEGIITRVDLGGERIAYTTVRHGTHVHLVCRRCGRVIEADHAVLGMLGVQVRQRYGFAVDLEHIALFGLCRDCQQTGEQLAD